MLIYTYLQHIKLYFKSLFKYTTTVHSTSSHRAASRFSSYITRWKHLIICHLLKLTARMLERPAPAPEIYVTTLGDDDLFARAHTTLHVTDGDDGLRIFFRFTSQIFPVRNNYYFADTTIKAYSIIQRVRVRYYIIFC